MDTRKQGAASTELPRPEVSIGLPVYNAAATIRAALDSLLSQTFTDFELVVSDNHSDDETLRICRRYAEQDARIQLVAQPVNRGAVENFRTVLNLARGTYFMWAAADDRWDPSFLEENHRVLASDPSIALSISRVRMPSLEGLDARQVGTYPLRGSFPEKLRAYLQLPGANSRFYGLYRREQIAEAMVEGEFFGFDWAVVIGVLKKGDAYEVPRVLMERSGGGSSTRPMRQQARILGQQGIHTVLPMLRFSLWLWANVPWAARSASLRRLLHLNARYTHVALLGTGNRKRIRSRLSKLRGVVPRR